MLDWTGERMVTDYSHYGGIEHIHRYSVVGGLVTDQMEIVDVACGEGYGTSLLSGKCKKITGIDISESTIRHARQKYTKNNIEFICASALNIPLQDNSVDMVVSFETIEHLEEHEKLISEFKRILKTGGLLVISTPDKRYIKEEIPNPYHIRELDLNEFSCLLKGEFRNVRFIFQKEIYGSIIFDAEANSSIKQYQGTFEEVQEHGNLLNPEFCIGLASDSSIGDIFINASLFDAKELHETRISELRSYKRKYKALVYSRNFKILNRIMTLAGRGFKI
jgi:ubiquinone/menaquinone biosynthesis C-methylase UbiE